MASVDINAISVDYGKHRVLDGLDLSVRDGESLAVVGPSSCGKTTLMRALCGFIKISTGSIKLDGIMVSDAATRQFLAPEKRRIGVVFQDYAVWPHLTVLENIIYPLRKQRVPKAIAQERARNALSQVKMADFGNRLPAQLSGGQQQRVALARALVSSDSLIVLDEPITNLDAKLREEMAYEIRQLQASTAVTILYITHDQETAMTIADRMVIMDKQGTIHQIGTPEEVWTNPADKYVFEFLGVSNFVPVALELGRLRVKDRDQVQEVDFRPASRVVTSPGNQPGSSRRADKAGSSGTADARLAAADARLAVADARLVAADARLAVADDRLAAVDDLLLAIRPMDVVMHAHPQPGMLVGTVERVTYLGNQFDYIVALGGQHLRVQQDSYDAFARGVPAEGSPCGLDLGNSVFYRSSDSTRLDTGPSDRSAAAAEEQAL
jgi:iron(III) transport system ATP-binding protein